MKFMIQRNFQKITLLFLLPSLQYFQTQKKNYYLFYVKKNGEDFHLKYKSSIMMLEVILHLIKTGWMLLTRCNMIWFENLAIQMRQYNYYDVLHNFIQVKLHYFYIDIIIEVIDLTFLII